MAFIFFVLVAISVLTVTKSSYSDEGYLQEVSYRSVFADYQQDDDGAPQVSEAWEKLPFGALNTKGSLISMSPQLSCMVAVKDSVFYSTFLKSEAPEKSSLESPYTNWAMLDDSIAGTGGNMMVKGDDTTIFAVTEDNVVMITLDGRRGEGCGRVVNVEKVLSTSSEWASPVTGLTYSPFLQSLFLGFEEGPVQRIDVSSSSDSRGTVHYMDAVETGLGATTMLWVEKWRALLVSNNVAVFMVFYNDDLLPHRLQREWIGAIIGWTPTDLAYDAVNNAVWLTEMEAVHMLTADLQWRRYGFAQMAPMQNISSVGISNGIVWVGSDKSGLSRMWSDTSYQQLDATSIVDSKGGNGGVFKDPMGDPWTWQYYFGSRWLTSNVVNSIVVVDVLTADGTDSSAFVVSAAGISLMTLSPWTLKEKASAFTHFQLPQHDRHGITASCGIDFGDRSKFRKNVADSDGLWTSMHAMAQVYRFIATGDEDARALAWRAFEGLEMTSILTPAYPNYVARSFCKISDGDGGCPTSYDDMPAGWYNGSIEGWVYKGDTSSDELAGQMAALPMIYDYIATTTAEKERVLAIMEGLVLGIIENGYFLIDPETGKPTKWGYWAPSWLNDQAEYLSERGTNSVEITGWMVTLYSITGKDIYRNTFWELMKEHNYAYNVNNAKVDSAVDENHSDTELLMLGFHCMFYGRWRLQHGMSKAEYKERYIEVNKMLTYENGCEAGIQRTWLLLKGELNPIWLGIYAGTANQKASLLEEDVVATVFSLRHWAIDGISWAIAGGQRIDLDIPADRATFHERGGTGAVMRYIRPPTERAAVENNIDPFVVNGGQGGGTELEPGLWQLPYYIMLANGLV